MSNACTNTLRVRGKPDTITAWLQRAASATNARYPDQPEPHDVGWRVMHNLFPVPDEELARPRGGGGWELRYWGCECVRLFGRLSRLSSDEAELWFNTNHEPPVAWIAGVAARYPKLEFECCWSDEDCDYGRALYCKGKRVRLWTAGELDTDRKLLAHVFLSSESPFRAFEPLEAEIALHPDDAELYLSRAKAIREAPGDWNSPDAGERHPDQRLLDLERAIQLNPRLVEAQLELADEREEREGMAGAKQIYQRAIKQFPTSVRVLTRYARFLLRVDDEKAALKIARKASNLDPNDAEVWHVLAEAHYILGEYARCEAVLTHAIHLDPGHILPHFYHALCLMKRNACEDALRLLDEVEFWNHLFAHADAEYLWVRGVCLKNLKRWDDAIETLTDAIRWKSECCTPAALAERAKCQVKCDRYEEAIADISEAVRLKPQNTSYRSSRAGYLLMAGKFKLAQVALDSIGPSDDWEDHPVVILLARVETLRKKGRDAFALRCARMCVERLPDSCMPLEYLAEVLATSSNAKVRNGKEAMKVARRAYELSEGSSSSMTVLAAACGANKKFAEAAEWQQKAIEALDLQAKNDDTRARYRQYLALYQQRKPRRYVPNSPE